MSLARLTASDVAAWLSEARSASRPADLSYLRGIAVLEQLLANLVPQETALLANYPNPFNPGTCCVLGWPQCTGRACCKRHLFLYVVGGRFRSDAEDGDSEVKKTVPVNRSARGLSLAMRRLCSKRPWPLGFGRLPPRLRDCGGQVPARYVRKQHCLAKSLHLGNLGNPGHPDSDN